MLTCNSKIRTGNKKIRKVFKQTKSLFSRKKSEEAFSCAIVSEDNNKKGVGQITHG